MMTDIHDTAIKQAIRVLVDHCVIRAEDIEYRANNYIADPDTLAEMHSDVAEIKNAVKFLKDSAMVGDRSPHIADSFIEHIRRKL